MFIINWRSNEGYGDFISGLCYAHSSVIRYNTPVKIIFHWPNSRDHLQSSIDIEPIFDRFQHILHCLRPVDGLHIEHKFNSVPGYRFINQLEEFNPLHGLWYSRYNSKISKRLVVVWSSRHNLVFPGIHKDPFYNDWESVILNLENRGYTVQEITYRTPIKCVLSALSACQFGIGYEGMIHQLFKFMWKPSIIASQRYDLSCLLTPQAEIVCDAQQVTNNLETLLNNSRKKIDILLSEHAKYLQEKQDPTKHLLYNKPIY